MLFSRVLVCNLTEPGVHVQSRESDQPLHWNISGNLTRTAKILFPALHASHNSSITSQTPIPQRFTMVLKTGFGKPA